jgi:hypothetical protein
MTGFRNGVNPLSYYLENWQIGPYYQDKHNPSEELEGQYVVRLLFNENRPEFDKHFDW